jgi:L-aminopeptidase/D-esterase-like protein
VGEIRDEDGSWVARSRAPAEAPRYPESWDGLTTSSKGDEAPGGGLATNTVIGCMVTNARLTKIEACRVADMAHSGVVRAVRPAHTSRDGDALFCLATQQVESHVDLLADLAADAVAEAARRAVLTATTRDGIPGLADGSDAGGGVVSTP